MQMHFDESVYTIVPIFIYLNAIFLFRYFRKMSATPLLRSIRRTLSSASKHPSAKMIIATPGL